MNSHDQSGKRILLRPTKLFIGLYLSLIVFLFLYSFTQVDLGLTLTRTSVIASIQHAFQQIGYFQRPLSALLFSVISIFLFIFYIAFLRSVAQKLLSQKAFWIIVIGLTTLLTLSYTAFSYDIFNYIFDAKIITQYNENPYFKKALDYPQDPMLAFMHWTHRTYPYGPTWLVVTVPFSFLGLQYFLPTYFMFKIVSALSYVGTTYLVGRILRKVSPQYELMGMAAFALNPLVIIESLVSGHNDIVMMFFGMASIFLLVTRRYVFSLILLLFSIGIKYATGFLLPLFATIYLFDRRKVPIQWEGIFLTFLAAMAFAVVAASMRTTFQPWYLLFVLPISALVSYHTYIRIPVIILSLAGVINYLPFLYTGNWDEPIPQILLWVNVSAVGVGILAGLVLFLRQKSYLRG